MMEESLIDPMVDEYEALPTSNVSVHLMAGAIAGVVEHCAMYPLDSIKTKMQSLNPATKEMYPNVLSTIRTLKHTNEGMMSTYRGVVAVAMGAGPAHALYFASYETIKTFLGTHTHMGATHPLVSGTSGLIATVIHDGFMNPFEVVKQRLQMHNSPFKGVRHCVKVTMLKEGPRAFYRSYTTQVAMNIPFQTVHFSAYENLTAYLNPKGTYDPVTHMLAGAGAGALASAVTTPLDVLKTTLNTQEAALGQLHARSKYMNGMTEAALTVYRTLGLRGFVRGIGPRVLYQMPSTALSWSVYEFFKHFFFDMRE